MGPRTLLVLLGGVALLACGGETLGTDGGTPAHDGSAPGSDASSGADAPFSQNDAASVGDSNSQPPGILCTQGPGSGSGGQNSCEISLSETCTDGTTYAVDCQCPSAMCSCTQTSAMGGGSSGGNIPLAGCPACTPQAAWAACGFPQ
jgi:hypothetical protein